MLKFVQCAALLVIPLLLAGSAHAQAQWPERTVKVIVPQPAGASTDIIARTFTDALSIVFKQPFVIDNRPGANGIIGTDFVAHAPNDGYTLLFSYAGAQVVNQSLYKTARYDGARDFAAIAQVGSGGNFLVVPPSMPVNNLAEFIAYVKAKPPGSLSYGSWGVGSGGHLGMEAIKLHEGIDLQHVPYKSVIASLQDLMAGQIQVTFSSAASALPLAKGGQIKIIAIAGPRRSELAPDIKTLTEQGVTFNLSPWYGFFAPAGTPPEIVAKLNAEINRLIALPEMAQRWRILGFDRMPIKTPEEFSEQVKTDIGAWGVIVRASNIKAE